jgi:hypothetical protein
VRVAVPMPIALSMTMSMTAVMRMFCLYQGDRAVVLSVLMAVRIVDGLDARTVRWIVVRHRHTLVEMNICSY